MQTRGSPSPFTPLTVALTVAPFKILKQHTHTEARVHELSASCLYLNQKQIKTDAMATLIEEEYSALQLTRRLLLLKQLLYETHSAEARHSPAIPSNHNGPEKTFLSGEGIFLKK